MNLWSTLGAACAAGFATCVWAADNPGYKIIMNPDAASVGPGYVVVKGEKPGDPQYSITDPARSHPAIWSGPYLGIQAGYAWQNGRITDVLGFSVTPKPQDWMIGSFAGFNHQLTDSPLVLGVEADANWGRLKDSDVLGNEGGIRSQWSGSARARVGYAFERLLVFAAGGVAVTDRRAYFLVGPLSFSEKKAAIGWTVGGGLDVALSDHVFLRGEYRYTDYGTKTYRLAGSPFRTDTNESRVTGGVAYKFGW